MNEAKVRRAMSMMGIPSPIKNRGWLNAPCPLASWRHSKGTDHKPSFGVKIETGKFSHYYCFTCKATGHLWDLAAELSRHGVVQLDPMEVMRLELEGGIGEFEDQLNSTEDEAPSPLDEAAYGNLYEPIIEYEVAEEYLEGRGVSSRTAETIGLGYDPTEYRITFPVRDPNKKLFGYTGRSILDEDYYPYDNYPKIRDYYSLPKRHMLLGAHLHEHGFPVILVEGLFGYAKLHEIGVTEYATPLATMGSNLTQQQIAMLISMGVNDVTLAFDPDQAGDEAIWGREGPEGELTGGAIDLLSSDFTLRIPVWPESVIDPDQLSLEQTIAMLGTRPHL